MFKIKWQARIKSTMYLFCFSINDMPERYKCINIAYL